MEARDVHLRAMELGSHAAGSLLTWVLGIELGF